MIIYLIYKSLFFNILINRLKIERNLIRKKFFQKNEKFWGNGQKWRAGPRNGFIGAGLTGHTGGGGIGTGKGFPVSRLPGPGFGGAVPLRSNSEMASSAAPGV